MIGSGKLARIDIGTDNKVVRAAEGNYPYHPCYAFVLILIIFLRLCFFLSALMKSLILFSSSLVRGLGST